ncbi:MAG: DUF2282 domain-containing protein [Pseudomonadota bacterium]
MSKTSIAAQIAALASAVAIAAVPDVADADGVERCYGIALAGENDCATAFEHSCAGQSTEDYSGMDWTIVPMGTCVAPGSTSAFDGHGGPIEPGSPAEAEARNYG